MMNNILEVRDVTKRFGGVEAVKEATMAVPCGALVGLIGPNGAGKTTMVNLISKHQAPDAGSIWLDSKRIDHLAAHQVARAGLSRTYQQNRLFVENDVEQNIRMALGWSQAHRSTVDLSYPGAQGDEMERVEALLGFCDLTAQRHDSPANLSFLQRRHVELAQALSLAPKLLVLDEPFAGLSRDESLQFCEKLRECQRGGLSILLIDHNMQIVMGICEFLYVMHHGAVIASGDPKAICSNERVIKVYLAGEM